MKRFLIILFISLMALMSNAQSVQQPDKIPNPTVGKRVELLSIAARLAGYEEYNMAFNKTYVADIHQYFDKFKEHPLIKFMRRIRTTNSIGYSNVMFMAVYLNQPPALTPIVHFNKDVPNLNWGADTANKFVVLLQQFYNDADFEGFFKTIVTAIKMLKRGLILYLSYLMWVGIINIMVLPPKKNILFYLVWGTAAEVTVQE